MNGTMSFYDEHAAELDTPAMDHRESRYPYCVVWTPIPIWSWICPIVGHIGIATSSGVIRDFARPYFGSEDYMAFGKPTKYWKLNPEMVKGGGAAWDSAVTEASEMFKGRRLNLCSDNCHSFVAASLNLMKHNDSNSWGMIMLCFGMLLYGKCVSLVAFQKTWLPFLLFSGSLVCFFTLMHYAIFMKKVWNIC